MNGYAKKHNRIFARVWIMLILAVAGATAAYFSYARNFEEKYEANVRMIVTLTESSNNGVSIYDSIRSAQMAIGDVSQIITSDTVLDATEKESGISREVIEKALNIDAIPGTRILSIRVQMNTPESALQVIESLERNLRKALGDVDINITYVVLSSPHADSVPVNGSYPLMVMIAAAVGGIVLGGLINLAIGEKSNSHEKIHIRSGQLYD